MDESMQIVMDEMEKAPKPKEGHWLLIGYENVIPGLYFLEKECSECGYSHSLGIPDNYCPKCGSHNSGRYSPSIETFLRGIEKEGEDS